MQARYKPLFYITIVLSMAAFQWNASHPKQDILVEEPLTITTLKGDRHFTVEIASTPKEQETGFMNRANIPPDHGMIFIWDRDEPVSMWMKNTPAPLDMLFVDKDGVIVYIAKKAKPESTETISAGRPVRAVIELAGGAADANQIRTGDSVHDRFLAHAAP